MTELAQEMSITANKSIPNGFYSPGNQNIFVSGFDSSIPETHANFFDRLPVGCIPLVSFGHLNDQQVKSVLKHYQIESIEVEAKHLMGYRHLTYLNSFWCNDKVLLEPFKYPLLDTDLEGGNIKDYSFAHGDNSLLLCENHVNIVAHKKKATPITVYYCKELDRPTTDLAYHQALLKLIHDQLNSPKKKVFDIYSPKSIKDMRILLDFSNYFFIYRKSENASIELLTAPTLNIQGILKHYRQLVSKKFSSTEYLTHICGMGVSFKADDINPDGTLVYEDELSGLFKRLNKALEDGVLPTANLLILNNEWHKHQVKFSNSSDFDLSIPSKLYWVKNNSLSWSLYGSQATGDVELFSFRIAPFNEILEDNHSNILSPDFKDFIVDNHAPLTVEDKENIGSEQFEFKNSAEYLSINHDPEHKADLSCCMISESCDEDDYIITVDQSGNSYCKMTDENNADVVSFKKYIEEIVMDLFISYHANNS